MSDLDYDDYLTKQKEKTSDPIRRQKWLGEEWDLKFYGFKRIFNRYVHLLKRCENALCLGARTGQEVAALKEMGIEGAIGIDLVACLPYVVEGDIHNLAYEDASFDFVFSNVYDHALFPDKFCAEIARVLKPGGHVLLNFQVDTDQDAYSVTEVSSVTSDVLPLFPGFDVHVNMPIPQNAHAMNWELLLQKA